jgi:hypothetical protein
VLLPKSYDLMPVTLDLLIDDRLAATFAAVKSRGDLSAAGLGNGNHTSRPQRPGHDQRFDDRGPAAAPSSPTRGGSLAELKILRDAGGGPNL